MFREKFTSPYEQYRERIGQNFTVLGVITEPDTTHDVECLPIYCIRFEDGTEIEAWPEEVEAGARTDTIES